MLTTIRIGLKIGCWLLVLVVLFSFLVFCIQLILATGVIDGRSLKSDDFITPAIRAILQYDQTQGPYQFIDAVYTLVFMFVTIVVVLGLSWLTERAARD